MKSSRSIKNKKVIFLILAFMISISVISSSFASTPFEHIYSSFMKGTQENSKSLTSKKLANNKIDKSSPTICNPDMSIEDNWEKQWKENCMQKDAIYCENSVLPINNNYPIPKTQQELDKRCGDIEIEADQEYYANLCKNKDEIKKIAKENNNADWWDDMCGTDWRN